MNKFIIVQGLPFLYANGKAYAVRWDSEGFTVGAEVKLTKAPEVTYSELSVKAKCAVLDSIKAADEKKVALDEMKLEELKDFAEEKGIKLGSARTKAEIIEKINAAE